VDGKHYTGVAQLPTQQLLQQHKLPLVRHCLPLHTPLLLLLLRPCCSTSLTLPLLLQQQLVNIDG
jgi:hypothetical protein